MTQFQLLAAYCVLDAAMSVAAGFLMKSWAVSGQMGILLLAALSGALSTLFMALQIKYLTLSSVGTYMLVLAIVTNIIIGVCFFGEHLAPLQMVGIVLTLISILLVAFGATASA